MRRDRSRTFASPLALLIALALLAGGAFAEGAQGGEGFRLARLSEIEYARPDASAIRARLGELAESARAAEDGDQAEAILGEAQSIYDGFFSMSGFAYLKASLNRADEDWKAEERALSIATPGVVKGFFDLMSALYESEARDGILESRPLFFESLPAMGYLTDESLPLFEREAEWVCDYQEALAGASVTFWGKDYAYAELIADLSDYASVAALTQWYGAHGDAFIERYIELVRLRRELAETLGYASYAELALTMGNADYGLAEIVAFQGRVITEFVPIFQSLAVTASTYPELDAPYARLRTRLRSALERIDPELRGAFDAMERYDLYDIAPRKDKDPGAFTIYLPGLGIPFLFANYSGSIGDASSIAHEFGHYYAFLTAGDDGSFYDIPSMDLAEIYSQAMELFVSNYFDDMFGAGAGPRARKSVEYQFAAVIVATMYNLELELEIYSMDEAELTPDALRWMAKSVAGDYGLSIIGLDAILEYDWAMQYQMFAAPFYSMAYATSATVAFDLRERFTEDAGGTFALYREMIRNRGKGFRAVVAEAGLRDPFGEGRVGEIRALIEESVLGPRAEVRFAGW